MENFSREQALKSRVLLKFPRSTRISLPAVNLFDRSQIDRQTLSELRQLNEFYSVGVILAQWAIIVGAIQVSIHAQHWLIYLLAVVIIASRQQAIFTLAHEGIHYLLFKNKHLNNIVCDLLIAFPLGISTNIFRQHHFTHHKYAGEGHDTCVIMHEDDPAWEWPKPKSEAIIMFFKSILGLHFYRSIGVMLLVSPLNMIHFSGKNRVPGELCAYVGFFLGATFIISLFQMWSVIFFYWLIPFCTVFNTIFFMRNISEHILLKGNHELTISRNIKTSWLDKLIIAPLNSNYHLDHHLFPFVPWYNMPALHRILMQNPLYKKDARQTEYYLDFGRGVLREMYV